MPGDGASRAITDLFSRRVARRDHLAPAVELVSPLAVADPVFPTKAFRKFLSVLKSQDAPVLIDLGPVVGSNVTYFGEELGCKIFVEDLYAELERFARDGKLGEFPKHLEGRLSQPDASVDGILCWDLLDYLERPAARAVGQQVSRMLRPGGAALSFFATLDTPTLQYTKYLVVDDVSLRHRSYPATRGRQPVMLNREIIKMFDGLVVSDSFLLKMNTREILFQKPVYAPEMRTTL